MEGAVMRFDGPIPNKLLGRILDPAALRDGRRVNQEDNELRFNLSEKPLGVVLGSKKQQTHLVTPVISVLWEKCGRRCE